MDHDFPALLAAAVLETWPVEHAEFAPARDRLRVLFANCFLASLLREEARPISFRLLLCEPDDLPDDAGPPDGLHVLRLDAPRDFSISELRRMSPAVEFNRAMVGVECDGENARIWGVIHSGPGWIRQSDGGRRARQDLPPRVVVHVKAPGEIAVFCGARPLASLAGGRITQRVLDVFESRWLPSHFADSRTEVLGLHALARAAAVEPWAELDPEFVRVLAQHVVRRTLSVMRRARHGGTILFIPSSHEGLVGTDQNALLRIKYAFQETAGQRRFRTVLVAAMNALASSSPPDREVGWSDYSVSSLPEIIALDEAIFEVGHLFAGLSAVDGALVLNQRFELVGFGAEISGSIPSLDTVWKAIDVEASQVAYESVEAFGTRHRSVFRLCASRPEVLAVVVSQDANVRFVKRMGERVVYFEHRMVGAL